MTDVSVIIPAHNAATTIGRTLRSLAAEARVIHEIILVDDLSSDDTAEAARQAAGALSLPLTVLAATCRDCATARNIGIAAASAAWIYFIDADDQHVEGGLRHLLQKAAATPEAGMIVGASTASTGASSGRAATRRPASRTPSAT